MGLSLLVHPLERWRVNGQPGSRASTSQYYPHTILRTMLVSSLTSVCVLLIGIETLGRMCIVAKPWMDG